MVAVAIQVPPAVIQVRASIQPGPLKGQSGQGQYGFYLRQSLHPPLGCGDLGIYSYCVKKVIADTGKKKRSR